MAMLLRIQIAFLIITPALLGLVAAGPVAAEESARGGTVRIGLVGTLFRDTPAPLVQTLMRPFKSLMESATGMSGQLVPGIPPDDLGRQLKEEKVQLGVFHGFEFAWARQQHPELKPLMIAVNQQRHLRAYVLVRDDCPAATLADLQGKTLAVPRRTREHCHLFLERRCQASGRTPKEFFGKIVASPGLEAGLDCLVNGHVDAALCDGVFLDWYRQRKPERFARLKTVAESEVFPPAVVAYYGGLLDEPTLRRFREGLIAAKDNPRSKELMNLCQITAFEPIPDDYEKLLNDIAKAYPPVKEK